LTTATKRRSQKKRVLSPQKKRAELLKKLHFSYLLKRHQLLHVILFFALPEIDFIKSQAKQGSELNFP